MPALGEHGNVDNSALEVLRQKGFQIWRNDGANLFCAVRDGWDFMADSPISLLGLVSIWEHQNPSAYREYWWRVEGPLHRDRLPTVAPNYTSVIRRR